MLTNYAVMDGLHLDGLEPALPAVDMAQFTVQLDALLARVRGAYGETARINEFALCELGVGGGWTFSLQTY